MRKLFVGVLLLVMVGCQITAVRCRLCMIVLEWGGGILLAASTVFGLIYINKSERFKRK